jgi:hypothetical protein
MLARKVQVLVRKELAGEVLNIISNYRDAAQK